MIIRFGYELVYSVPQLTPMIFMLNSQPQGDQQLIRPDVMRTEPAIPLFFHRDAFGNTCTRLEAPIGLFCVTADGVMEELRLHQNRRNGRPANTPFAIFLRKPCSTF